jgi:hypothetical protein
LFFPHRLDGSQNRVRPHSSLPDPVPVHRITFTQEEIETARKLYAHVIEKTKSQVARKGLAESLHNLQAEAFTTKNRYHAEQAGRDDSKELETKDLLCKETDLESVGYEDGALSPTIVDIFTQLADHNKYAEESDEPPGGNEEKIMRQPASPQQIRFGVEKTWRSSVSYLIHRFPAQDKRENSKQVESAGFGPRNNSYLQTAISRHEPIEVSCRRCSRYIGIDPAPTYDVLPPLQGFYIVPHQLSYGTVCSGRSSHIMPVDITVKYMPYNDVNRLKTRAMPSLYERLQRRYCFGDKEVVISREELNMAPWAIQRNRKLPT